MKVSQRHERADADPRVCRLRRLTVAHRQRSVLPACAAAADACRQPGDAATPPRRGAWQILRFLHALEPPGQATRTYGLPPNALGAGGWRSDGQGALLAR